MTFLPGVVGPWAAFVIVRDLGEVIAEKAAVLSASESTRVVGEQLEAALASMSEAGRQRIEAHRAGSGSADGSTGVPSGGVGESLGVSSWVSGLTSGQVADLLEVSPRQVLNLREDSKLIGHRAGRAWVFNQVSVAALLESRGIACRVDTETGLLTLVP